MPIHTQLVRFLDVTEPLRRRDRLRRQLRSSLRHDRRTHMPARFHQRTHSSYASSVAIARKYAGVRYSSQE